MSAAVQVLILNINVMNHQATDKYICPNNMNLCLFEGIKIAQ